MKISYAICNSNVPAAFTAWGTYDPADYPPAGGACTMTDSGGGVVNGTGPAFRSDGIWTSQLSGLTIGSVYTLAASYTQQGGNNVPATPQDQLTVAVQAIPVPPPSEDGRAPLPIGALAARAARAAPAALAAGGSAVFGPGSYPDLVGITKLVGVVHQNNRPVYTSVTRGLAKFGRWVLVVPRPPDANLVDYVVEILFLNRYGLVVESTRAGL